MSYYAKPGYPVIWSLGQEGSAARRSRRIRPVHEIYSASLPACDGGALVGALKYGQFLKCSHFPSGSLDTLSKAKFHQEQKGLPSTQSVSEWAVLRSGCFNSLQHLDLSKLIFDTIWKGIHSDVDTWKVFVRAIMFGRLVTAMSQCQRRAKGTSCQLRLRIQCITSGQGEHALNITTVKDSTEILRGEIQDRIGRLSCLILTDGHDTRSYLDKAV